MVRRSKRGEGNFDNRKIEKKYKYRCKGFELVNIWNNYFFSLLSCISKLKRTSNLKSGKSWHISWDPASLCKFSHTGVSSNFQFCQTTFYAVRYCISFHYVLAWHIQGLFSLSENIKKNKCGVRLRVLFWKSQKMGRESRCKMALLKRGMLRNTKYAFWL